MTARAPTSIPVLGWCFDSIRIASKFASLTEWLESYDLRPTWVCRTVHTQAAFLSLGLDAVCIDDVLSEDGLESNAIPDDARLEELYSYDREAGRRIVDVRGAGGPAEEARKVALAWSILIAHVRPRLVLNLNGIPGVSATLTALARDRGIPVWFLENGLIPETLVLDPEGVNAGSSAAAGGWRVTAESLGDDAVEAARTLRLRIVSEARSIVTHGAELSARGVLEELRVPPTRPVVLVPLQVEQDTNIVRYSPHVRSMHELVLAVRGARGPGPDGPVLVIKEHPKRSPGGDPAIRALEDEHIRYVSHISLSSLLPVAQQVICINSTVGLEALLHEKPVITLGHSTYSGAGLTEDLSGRPDWRSALEELFGTGGGPRRPDPGTLDRFLAVLLSTMLFPCRADRDPLGFRGIVGARLRSEALAARPELLAPAGPQPRFAARLEALRARCREVIESGRGRLELPPGDGAAETLREWWGARFPGIRLELAKPRTGGTGPFRALRGRSRRA